MTNRFLVFLTVMFLFAGISQAGMTVYKRLGDLPETADIYLMLGEEDVVFIDASSIPAEFRARITKNPETFQKVNGVLSEKTYLRVNEYTYPCFFSFFILVFRLLALAQ